MQESPRLRSILTITSACRGEEQEGRRRDRQEQYPADRSDRLRQDAAGRNPGAVAQCAVYDRRCHHAHRGRLRRRGRGNIIQSCCRNATTMSKGTDRHRLHRRDRQDLAQIRQPVDHAMYRARGAAGAAEADRGYDRLGAPQGGANTRNRSSCRSIPKCAVHRRRGVCRSLTRSSATVPKRRHRLFRRGARKEDKRNVGEIDVQRSPRTLSVTA